MPSYPCRHPVCTNYVPRRGGFCVAHEAEGRRDRAERNRYYDQHVRDPEAKKFYDSAAWQRARATKLANDPVCERCRRVFATTVHHKIPVRYCSPELRTAQSNLKSFCGPCHNTVEAEAAAGRGAA